MKDAFSSRIGFIAASVGSAVGLGNIWKFPYEAGANGGAVFLLFYLLFTVVLGFPVLVSEISLGRATGEDAYSAFVKTGGKTWSIVGVLGIITAIFALSYYIALCGWAVGYLFKMISGELSNVSDYSTYFLDFAAQAKNTIIYTLIFMSCVIFVVSKGIKNGIERASKLLLPTLLFLMIGLIIYSLTLPNASEGVKFYLLPDINKISLKTIYSALGQSFFSLSLGICAFITYGAYLSKKENIISTAGLIVFSDLMVALLAGFLIFPLIFSMGLEPTQGPGLVFVALPQSFADMGPIIGRVIGITFFLLLCFAAFTTAISILEIPAAFLVNRGWRRNNAVLILGSIIFLLSIPCLLSIGAVDLFTNFTFYEGVSKSYFDLIVDVFTNTMGILISLLLILFVLSRWKYASMASELKSGYGSFGQSRFSGIFKFMIIWICPILLSIMFTITVLQKFFNFFNY